MLNGGTDHLSAERIDVNDQEETQSFRFELVNDLEIFSVPSYDFDSQAFGVFGDEQTEASHDQNDFHPQHEQLQEDFPQDNVEQLQLDPRFPSPDDRPQQAPTFIQQDQSSSMQPSDPRYHNDGSQAWDSEAFCPGDVGLMGLMDNRTHHSFQQQSLDQSQYGQLFQNGLTQLQTGNSHPVESSLRHDAYAVGSEVAPFNVHRDFFQSNNSTYTNSAYASSRDETSSLAWSHSNYSHHDASRSSASPLGDLQLDVPPQPQPYQASPASSQHNTMQSGYTNPGGISRDEASQGHQVKSADEQHSGTLPKRGAYSASEEKYISDMMSAGMKKEDVAAALGRTPQGVYIKWKRMQGSFGDAHASDKRKKHL